MIIVLHPKYPKIPILRYQQFTIKLRLVMIVMDWGQKRIISGKQRKKEQKTKKMSQKWDEMSEHLILDVYDGYFDDLNSPNFLRDIFTRAILKSKMTILNEYLSLIHI